MAREAVAAARAIQDVDGVRRPTMRKSVH